MNLSGIDSEFITAEKAFKFALSFTRNDRPIEEKEYHWRKYANGFKGAEFEIDSTKLPFNLFSLNVNYLEEPIGSNLISNIAKMKLSRVALKALIPIFCAIKNRDYKEEEEEEVRLFLNGDKNVIESIHYGDKSNYVFQLDNDNNISYLNMVPILFENDEPKYDNLLRLKKIYLGKDSNVNFGQQFMLRHIYDFCHLNGIGCEDLAWK